MAKSRRHAGALIGIAGAIGAFGGVLVNLAFRQSFLATKSADAAYIAFIAFYALCFAVTWYVYIRQSAAQARRRVDREMSETLPTSQKADSPCRQTFCRCTFPLRGRRVVVVGGGPVAARKVGGLPRRRADVLVVAPYACEQIVARCGGRNVEWQQRDYRPATWTEPGWSSRRPGDRGTDEAGRAGTRTRERIFCVRADDATAGSAWRPAVVRRDDMVGQRRFASAAEQRPIPGERSRCGTAIAQALDSGRCRCAGIGRVLDRWCWWAAGRARPDLLTLRGRRELAAADVVVVDRLAPQAVLDELAPGVLILDVGKAPGRHPVPQHEINRLLVEHAKAGRQVVRLKGGDPYLLGRGGEEVAACREAGVPVTVVPGVTSAFSVPAAAASRSPTAGCPGRSRCCPAMTPWTVMTQRSTGSRWPPVAAPSSC